MKHALNTTREDNFAAWYQDIVAQADLAEESGVRGMGTYSEIDGCGD